MSNALNVLYNYRRCPYAMRARMALVVANIQCSVHEIDFKNKPTAMLEVSPKGTVPVLVLGDGTLIDESLDVVLWALGQGDPEGYLDCDVEIAKALIAKNDGAFKAALDRYKYPNRFPDEDCSNAREEALSYLKQLESLLQKHKNLMGDNVSVADICIFPFVRQFANVDKEWFEAQDILATQSWLNRHIQSDLFQKIFKKQDEAIYQLV